MPRPTSRAPKLWIKHWERKREREEDEAGEVLPKRTRTQDAGDKTEPQQKIHTSNNTQNGTGWTIKYRCHICGFTSADHGLFHTHMMEHQQQQHSCFSLLLSVSEPETNQEQETRVIKPHVCDLCPHTSNTRDNLRRHYKRKHPMYLHGPDVCNDVHTHCSYKKAKLVKSTAGNTSSSFPFPLDHQRWKEMIPFLPLTKLYEMETKRPPSSASSSSDTSVASTSSLVHKQDFLHHMSLLPSSSASTST